MPKQTNKLYITDAYKYKINNKQYDMVSISNPLIKNNKFLGVVGVDILLTDIFNNIDNFSLFKKSYNFIVSNRYPYTIISHANKSINGNLSKYLDNDNRYILNKIKNLETCVYVQRNPVNNIINTYIGVPIKFNNEG
jgi:methyl-accepting chemotaxis protein